MDHIKSLRLVLGVNAAATGLCALPLVFFAGPLAALFGAPAAWPLFASGVLFAIVALGLAWCARAKRLGAGHAALFAVVDGAWVVGSAALLLARPELLAPLGRAVAAAIALAVAVFAALELRAWRALRVVVVARGSEAASGDPREKRA